LKENGMARVFLASVIAAAFFANAYASPSAKRIETTGDPRLDGILSNFTWGSPDLMYAFPSEPIARQPKDILFEPLPDEQRAIIRSVFTHLELITYLHFVEIDQADDAQLTFARWDQPSLLGRVNASFLRPGGGGSVDRHSWSIVDFGRRLNSY
jgi:hypothetical protein